jgi:hypothetical protein
VTWEEVDQGSYVYIFMFFQTVQAFFHPWAVPDNRQTNT